MEEEATYVFPILGLENEIVKKALKYHRRLERLINESVNLGRSLSLLEEELSIAVRFEERILFTEIEKHVTQDILEMLSKRFKNEKFIDDSSDEFWL